MTSTTKRKKKRRASGSNQYDVTRTASGRKKKNLWQNSIYGFG